MEEVTLATAAVVTTADIMADIMADDTMVGAEATTAGAVAIGVTRVTVTVTVMVGATDGASDWGLGGRTGGDIRTHIATAPGCLLLILMTTIIRTLALLAIPASPMGMTILPRQIQARNLRASQRNHGDLARRKVLPTRITPTKV